MIITLQCANSNYQWLWPEPTLYISTINGRFTLPRGHTEDYIQINRIPKGSSYIIHPEIRSNFNFKGKGGRGQPWSDHTPVCPVISGVLRCLSDHHLGHELIVNINREEAGSLGTSWWSGCCTIDREVQYYIKFRQPCGRCTYLGWKSSPFKNLQK